MTLELHGAKDDFVMMTFCSDDKEGTAFLVHGSYGEGKWCCNVCDCVRSQWLLFQGLDGKRRGERVRSYRQGGSEGLVNEVPCGTGVH